MCLKAGSQYMLERALRLEVHTKMIWTRVTKLTCTYAGIEIISIPAYATHIQIILYALPVATRHRQIMQRSLKRIL